jgi:hypothetical protein
MVRWYYSRSSKGEVEAEEEEQLAEIFNLAFLFLAQKETTGLSHGLCDDLVLPLSTGTSFSLQVSKGG